LPAPFTAQDHSHIPELLRAANSFASGYRELPSLDEVLKTMRERAAKFNVEKIRPQDLAGAGGPPDEER